MSEQRTTGRLSGVIDRWIYSTHLAFGLRLDEQGRTRFRYAYSVYLIEYSWNLLFASGGHMDQVFGAVVDRARSRLAVPKHQPQRRGMRPRRHSRRIT